MKYFFYLLVIIILFGLNIGLFNNLQFYGQLPNLPLLLVICCAVESKTPDYFFVAFVCGLFMDYFSPGPFGQFTLAFLVLALLLHFVVNSLLFWEISWKSLTLILIGSLAVFNLILWLSGILAAATGYWTVNLSFKNYAVAFAPSLIYDWLLLYPMYRLSVFLIGKIHNLTARRGPIR